MKRERFVDGRDTALLVAVPLLALVAFAGAVSGGFVHDDHRQIVGNPMVHGLSNLPALFTTGVWAGAGSASSWYRPPTMSSFAFDRALLGPVRWASMSCSSRLSAPAAGQRPAGTYDRDVPGRARRPGRRCLAGALRRRFL